MLDGAEDATKRAPAADRPGGDGRASASAQGADRVPAPAPEPLSRLDWIWKLSAIVANATVAITVAVAVLSYLGNRETARLAAEDNREREARTAALSYVTRFQTGEMLDARNEVYAAFLELGPEQIPPLGLTDEVRSALVESMIEARPDPLAMRVALANITDFYDGVEACRAAGLCDADILDASLASYGVRFQCFFDSYVARTRSVMRVADFGSGLEAIVARQGGCG